MKNLNTYKGIIYFTVIFLLSCSCKNKIFINENNNVYYIEAEIRKNIIKKKTGVYIYPKKGMRFSVKNGTFNGIFEIIKDKQDTIFFCKFENGYPIGRYIYHFKTANDKYMYYRIIPIEFKDYEKGKGYFNKEHNKDGVWEEFKGNEYKKGIYLNGMKEGVWKEEYFNDEAATEYSKKGIYINDKKEGVWSFFILSYNYEEYLELLYKEDCVIDTLCRKKKHYF